MVIISTEAKEITVVNLVGSIRPQDLTSLGGQFGIPKVDTKKKEQRMTRLPATLIALALCAAPQTASAAPSEFDRIVHAVEAQTGALRLHLVGMGFFFRASALFARAARASDWPAGASDFQTAIFYASDKQHGF